MTKPQLHLTALAIALVAGAIGFWLATREQPALPPAPVAAVTPEFRPVTDSSTMTAVRRKLGVGDDPFILSLGTIQPRKNFQRLIQAFARLEGQMSLVIVGGAGWEAQPIYNEVAAQGP